MNTASAPAAPRGRTVSTQAADSSAGDRPIARAVSGLTLLGAGLVHFAVAPAQATPLLAGLAVLATAELAFSIGVLSGRLVPSVRLIGLSSAPLIVWAVFVFADGLLGAETPLPVGPMLAAAALNFTAALSLAASVRLSRRVSSPARPWMFTAALVAGAVMLPFIAVPAMSAAQHPSGDQPSMSHLNEHHH
ncbi:hypothetical protein [Paramicrobacterium agarici]|uniref:Uncharacterized protein n=1 Tax=Paramicrobacterium agarici TaxID=630514 RepID=A0A2A9DWA3_9MICO|nr:hypothetical protein [Microbacterium agarici]PFG30646.1 hypothetical protein ATJ78_1581 [Microbacterium agarici]